MSLTSASPVLATRDYGLGGKGLQLVIVSVLGPILAASLVFNRAYWRLTRVNSLGHDDICILLSLVFLFAECIANLVAVDHGYGRPSSSIPEHDLFFSLKMFYLSQILWKLTINLTKLSILTLYLRIFAHTTQRWFRITVLSTMFLVTLYSIASITVTIFQCSPVHRAWQRSQPGTCINTTAFWYSNAIYNLFTDGIILVSVPGVIWSLHLPLRQRLALTGVFGLGIFVFATSILRFTTLRVSSRAKDTNAGTLNSTMWTTIEANCAVVCACLPMVRTPLQKIWPKFFPTSRAYGTGTTARDTGTNSGVHTHPKRNLGRPMSRASHLRPTSSQRAMADLRGETIINAATNTSSFQEDQEHEQHGRNELNYQVDRPSQPSTRTDEQDLEMGQLPNCPPRVAQADDDTVTQQARWNSPQSWDTRFQQQYRQHQLDGAVDDYFFNHHRHHHRTTAHDSPETKRLSSVHSNETDWFAGLPIRPWSYYHSGKGLA